MGTPEIIFFIMVGFSIIRNLIDDGQQHTADILKSIPMSIYAVGIYIWGGFFNYIGAPQIIFIILMSIAIVSPVIGYGRYYPQKHSFISSIIGVIIISVLLYWGGFFA